LIRGAGYRGCAGGSGPLFNTLNDQDALENDFRTGIQGFDDVSEILPEPLASTFAGKSQVPIAGTDVLVVRGPEGKARIFQVGSIADSGAITHPTGGLVPGNSDGTWGGAAAPPHEQFGTDVEIIRYDTFIYCPSTLVPNYAL